MYLGRLDALRRDAPGNDVKATIDRGFDIPSCYPKSIKGRMKICLVADCPNWAFENIAKSLARQLSGCCDVEILCSIDFEDFAKLHRALFMGDRDCDLIHFFWRPALFALFNPETLVDATAGLSPREKDIFLWNAARPCKTTSIQDHMFLGDDELDIHHRRSLAFADAYTVCSPQLETIYSNLEFLPSPASLISDGVDLDRFKPRDLHRLNGNGHEIRVGWAGNSEWGPPDHDHKGLKTVIAPTVEKLRQEGHCIQGVFQDRQVSWKPHEDMPDFYNSLDVYVCASLNEGTPNPILEAMACGLPILSTDVGIVRSAFGPLQQEFIVKDRNAPEFHHKLRLLISDPDLRRRLSEENLNAIQAWSWNNKAMQWLSFFARALDARARTNSRFSQWSMLTDVWRFGDHARWVAGRLANQDGEQARQQEILNRPSFRLLAKLSNPITKFLHGPPLRQK